MVRSVSQSLRTNIGHRGRWLAGAISLGFVIGLTNLLAPIHEIFHLARAAKDGVGGGFSSWTSVHLDSPDLYGQVTAGWFGEIWACLFATLALAIAGRKWGFLTGGFPIGYAWATWLRGYVSFDFHEGLASYVAAHAGQYSPGMLAVAEASMRERIIIVWTVLCALTIALGVAAAVYGVRKKKARAAGP